MAGELRAFVALDLDAKTRERLAGAIETLRLLLRGVKWVRPEGIHLTLRFLGGSSLEALECLKPQLAAAAARCPKGVAPLRRLGIFPERGAPRVLWSGLDLDPPFLDLQAACEAAARGCGFTPERRVFAPHLTLGRWRDAAPRPALPGLDLGATRLERLSLLRSDLHPGGAVYTSLASFPLSDP